MPPGRLGSVRLTVKAKVAHGQESSRAIVEFDTGQVDELAAVLWVDPPVRTNPQAVEMAASNEEREVDVALGRDVQASLESVWPSNGHLKVFGETEEAHRRWRIVVRGGLPRDAEEEWIVLSFATARGESWRTFIPVRPRQAQVWDGMLK